MIKTILHITDLHLADINSDAEKLRVGFYQEFIDGLVKEMKSTFKIDSVDHILCTGDFVDKGEVKNFSHAKSILDYFAKQLNCSKNISICIGNHDFIRALDSGGKQKEARQAYYDFEKEYLFGKECVKTDYYQIRDFNDCMVLIFDSTYGSNGSNGPSELNVREIDNVITDVSKHVPTEKPLLILSHFPMVVFPRSQQYLEEIGWVDKHLWKSGATIVERIFNKREASLTFWFFGDGHAPDFTSYNPSHHFLMTGMLGGNYTNPTFKDASGSIKPFNKFTEAKLIVINEDITINTLSYRSKGHNLSPHTGFWEVVPSKIRLDESPAIKIRKSEKPVEVKPDDLKTELIGESVQKEIIDTIRARNLYSFNRYSTSDEDVSLGWVSIPKLLESRDLLNRCIDKSILWLKETKQIAIDSDCLIIGLDIWGSVFATQVAVRENVKNFCIATKDGGKHNVHFERIDSLCERIKDHNHIKTVIIFTDVVATGNTVVQFKSRVESILSNGMKWICFSIISDKKQKRVQKFDEFNIVGTLCSDLILPIMKKSDLPDETIFPSNSIFV